MNLYEFFNHKSYYYNFIRRQKLGKNITRNNGNFFSLKGTYYFSEEFYEKLEINDNQDCNPTDLLTVGVVYGLQRTYFDWLHLSFESGMAYGETENGWDIIPILSFTVGYAF
ncbi:hypothetical protein [Aquimarina sp. RZ0]|uniref:hypothetical protein n=1 Tax=Aquimarina sp. RZ0 TaxID=2607730 RepID=UPI0011F1FFAA|nr:hypothetical protein [Aquimarina sp. RZ0]KAA1243884.1 hypothetical protein F0000_19100 [Aquimarina sp. RZ0]